MESPIDQQDDVTTRSPIPEPEAVIDEEKSYIEFRSYGIITYWIFIFFFGGTFLSIFQSGLGGVYFWILVASIAYGFIRGERKTPLGSFTFAVASLFFGLKATNKQAVRRAIRLNWFYSIGLAVSTMIAFLLAASLSLVIPLIIVLVYRKNVLRFLFNLSFLPNRKYVYYESKEYREEQQEAILRFSESEREYMIFLKPSRITYLIGYSLIIIIPIFLAIAFIPLQIAWVIENDSILQVNYEQVITLGIVGLLAIIPYFILFRVVPKKYRLSNFATTKLAHGIINVITGTKVNNIPALFDGEYFIERESTITNMSSGLGFFEIFKRGRLLTIFLIPLALVTYFFRLIINNADVDYANFSPESFLSSFVQQVFENPIFIVLVFVVVPILLSIILPLLFVLSGAEIKRSKWHESLFDESRQEEIKEVEDIGKTINNIIKLVLGIGTITGFTATIQGLDPDAGIITVNLVTGVVLVIGGLLIFPGVFYMVFQYFAQGAHVESVNFLRYQASQSPDIAVGTVRKEYEQTSKLSLPSMMGPQVIDNEEVVSIT